jgi:GNAT superfamily N-acetyltransferase
MTASSLDVVFTPEHPADPSSRVLTAALDADIRARYPGVEIHFVDPAALTVEGGVFMVGRLEGVPVACGALRPLGPGLLEVKRMFVAEAVRRRGVARQLIEALEGWARARGRFAIRVETGYLQHEAIALYQRAGYLRVANYGEYAGNPYSVCFEKEVEALP